MWRSLVAHLTGGQGVAGSNPVIPTNKQRANRVFRLALLLLGRSSFVTNLLRFMVLTHQGRPAGAGFGSEGGRLSPDRSIG